VLLSTLLIVALGLDPALIQDLPWRNVGPAIMGGRIDDVAVVESDPDIIYIGAATGGVWKTVNGGTTWEPIFDDYGTTSIGDVAVAPSNPNIVWIGTGEANNRQSSSWGNGVWKSTDAGRTFTHVGLRDSHHIGRIVIDPRNPEVVYVAAVGRLWGPHRERGLFKTTDGGRTWTNTKFIDEDTGFTDVAMDPSNASVLYAAAYQRRRTPWGFSGSGPGSGLYKTTDGARTWTKLVSGLPSGDLGRIGLDVYRRNGAIVYATIEHRREGGVYRSDNAGKTWAKVNGLNPRPLYYSQVRIDPTDDRRIYVLGPPLYVSDDGGKTFRSDGARNVHVDHHALWIDPREPSNLVLGNDGGVFLSRDRARTWTRVNNIPLGQFYGVGADMRQPYHLYGGLQDNGVWSGPSATWNRVGPLNDDWIQVAGGDGMSVATDPIDPGTAYVSTQNGRLMRFDTASGERKGIRPFVHDPDDLPAAGEGTAGAAKPRPPALMRFYWTTPLAVSAHNPRTLYIAGNRLWRSVDRGERWLPASPDLTKQIDRATLEVMGRKVTEDTLSANDGVTQYGNATAFAESPLDPGVLAVGMDDGNVQMTTDGGVTWTNLSDRFAGVPDRTTVSRIVFSAHDRKRMYVAFDGHQQNDFEPRVYRSDDAGATWRPAAAGLSSVVRTLIEDPRRPDLLFAGLENGMAVTWDGGTSWSPLKNRLPDVPVYDLQVHPRDRDLIAGTHGRSIYVLPIAPLQELTERVRGDALHLFPPRAAVAFNFLEHRDFLGQATYVGANPPYGAAIDYWVGGSASAPLKGCPPCEGTGCQGLEGTALAVPKCETVTLVIKDRDGTVVRQIEGPGTPGLHRVVWDMRHASPAQPPRPEPTAGVDPSDPRPAESTLARIRGDYGGGGDPTGGEAGEPRQPVEGPEVLAGDYRITLTARGQERSGWVIVAGDPRAEVSDEDRRARFDLLWRVYELQQQVYPLQQRLSDLSRQLREVTRAMDQQKDTPDDLRKAGAAASTSVRDLTTRLGRAMQQATGVGRDVAASTSAPTVAQREQFDRGVEPVPEILKQADETISGALAAFAADLEKRGPAKVPRLRIGTQ
jgi:photosystem II stability/assembly factor-like uncharacterized protein